MVQPSRRWLHLSAVTIAALLLALLALLLPRGKPDWQSPPAKLLVLSTRGCFDMDGQLLRGKADALATGYPELSAALAQSGASDLVLVLHGFNNSPEKALYKFAVAEESMRQSGFDGLVAGWSWDSDRQRDPLAATGYRAARRVAVGNAAPLARVIGDLRRDYPALRLHLVGYSMGARLALEALLELDAAAPAEPPPIASLHLLGAAVDDEELEVGERYGSAAEHCCAVVVNYFSPEDNKLGSYFPLLEGDRALGEAGIEHVDRAPANYSERDVTSLLPSYDEKGKPLPDEDGDNHSGYLGTRDRSGRLLDPGAMPLVAQAIAKMR